jgi:23S rRNA (cytidine2498-2'-O)-methyltransferase
VFAQDGSIVPCTTLCFSSWNIINSQRIELDSGENRVKSVADWFCDAIRTLKIENPWVITWFKFSENGYLPDVNKAQKVLEILKKKISRVVKLASVSYPTINTISDGLFIVEAEEGLFISRSAIFSGPRRMKDDPAAPSRSYLKIEEAFSVFGREPETGESVIDLGAAPGGWSYAAAKRGARVIAIDNGPMKNGAAGHKNITHVRADAFRWEPERSADWLFCDMVEEPSRVLALLKQWINKKLFVCAVVNLKCGHTEPFDILKLVKSSNGLSSMVKEFRCSHLYHDRDEFTIMMRI